MKPLLLSAALLFSTPLLHAAQGPLKETALALANSHKDSVLFLSAVVEIEITAGGEARSKELRARARHCRKVRALRVAF